MKLQQLFEHLLESAKCQLCTELRESSSVTRKSRQHTFVKRSFYGYPVLNHCEVPSKGAGLALFSASQPSGWGSVYSDAHLWFVTLISKKLHLNLTKLKKKKKKKNLNRAQVAHLVRTSSQYAKVVGLIPGQGIRINQ